MAPLCVPLQSLRALRLLPEPTTIPLPVALIYISDKLHFQGEFMATMAGSMVAGRQAGICWSSNTFSKVGGMARANWKGLDFRNLKAYPRVIPAP